MKALYIMSRSLDTSRHDLSTDNYANNTPYSKLYRVLRRCGVCGKPLDSDLGALELTCRYSGKIGRVSRIDFFDFTALSGAAARDMRTAIQQLGLTGVEIREATVTEFEELIDIPPEKIDQDGNVIYPTVRFPWMPICIGRPSTGSKVVNLETGESFDVCHACGLFDVGSGEPPALVHEEYLLPRDLPNGFRVPSIVGGFDQYVGQMVVDDVLRECILEHLGDSILEFKPFDYVFE